MAYTQAKARGAVTPWRRAAAASRTPHAFDATSVYAASGINSRVGPPRRAEVIFCLETIMLYIALWGAIHRAARAANRVGCRGLREEDAAELPRRLAKIYLREYACARGAASHRGYSRCDGRNGAGPAANAPLEHVETSHPGQRRPFWPRDNRGRPRGSSRAFCAARSAS